MPTTADYLTAAAHHIHTHGWTRGTLHDTNGAVCALGAIRTVTPTTPSRRVSDAEHACLAALAAHLGLPPGPDVTSPHATHAVLVTDWNDHPDRTRDEVTTALRAAAQNAAREAS